MLKSVEPELRKCEGYKRSLAAEQVTPNFKKEKVIIPTIRYLGILER